ncbi:hypothetical protein GCM10010417_37080 [Streptomyces carpaticus]
MRTDPMDASSLTRLETAHTPIVIHDADDAPSGLAPEPDFVTVLVQSIMAPHQDIARPEQLTESEIRAGCAPGGEVPWSG